MKKAIVLSTLIAAAAVNPAYAADDRHAGRKAGVFFGSAIAGAMLAGPIGLVVGAASGVWLDDKVEQADSLAQELQQSNSALQTSHHELSRVQSRLLAAEDHSQRYAQLILEQLQVELLFKTGGSELSAAGQQRLAMLEDFMANNPELNLRLDGYADPSGDQQFNLALSEQRVNAVAEQLKLAGLDEQRIATYSHGASQSQAQQGDYQSYAMERVVRIQLSRDDEQALADSSLR
ncbi:OmpA family protein [Dasania marina]|uniref:OmpA family protein n=1 Tax=Dasania marina TaxID=471499 RepID=UPI0030D9B32E|tara:strand:- start:16789 stop:17490 length:702 start_codon:yes stop_codon:yes gene_type:complete